MSVSAGHSDSVTRVTHQAQSLTRVRDGEVRDPSVTSVTRPRNQREADRRVLLAFLADLQLSGRRIPCQDGSIADISGFTSDDEREQQRAARLCVGCAGATTCGQYGSTYPKEFGVYGGATNSERQPRRGRPAKTSSKGAAA